MSDTTQAAAPDMTKLSGEEALGHLLDQVYVPRFVKACSDRGMVLRTPEEVRKMLQAGIAITAMEEKAAAENSVADLVFNSVAVQSKQAGLNLFGNDGGTATKAAAETARQVVATDSTARDLARRVLAGA